MLSIHSNGPEAGVYIYTYIYKTGVVYKERICIIDI